VYAQESDLADHSSELIATLTDAVVAVYGDWAREIAVVQLIGLPAGRWGIGGLPASSPIPRVVFGIRDAVFSRPDAVDLLSRLASGVTDAIADVLGSHLRPEITVEFAGAPDGRTSVGGVLVSP
jgi:phenylpyruvate tautomerase PptA (4-oxalocrotonate tautomerase family)